MSNKINLSALLEQHKSALLPDWIKEQLSSVTLRKDLMTEAELRQQSEDFYKLLCNAAQSNQLTDIMQPEWANLREFLKGVSRSRGIQGFNTAETATFILSFKQPLFKIISEVSQENVKMLADSIWAITILIDKLGLYTIEAFQKVREEIIKRQQEELLELSTPVVKLWDGILALPMIGTLDSSRTQVVMENLLQQIVATESEMAIIDITGVPNVDSIISGIRPQIAQTIVHLGVDLSGVITKASLADAFKLALARVKDSRAKTTLLQNS